MPIKITSYRNRMNFIAYFRAIETWKMANIQDYKAFYSDGFKIGMEAVQSGLTKESIKNAASRIYENIDGLIDSLLGFAEKNNTKVYCFKGCGCCCWQPVFSLTHEIIYLNDYIRENFSGEEIGTIQNKAKEKAEKLGGLDKEALLNSKHPCPLLKDDACSVYPARPMACRIYLSLDFNSCKKFFDESENQTSFPYIMDFPLKAGRMMNEGFKAALKQAGWISQEIRLDEGLAKLREPLE
jgi:Fe-S-cluster containining protein